MTAMEAAKTLGNAISKSRKGSIPLNLDRLVTQPVSKISADVFAAFTRKTAELLDPEEERNMRAIQTLADTDSRSAERYLAGAGIGAITNPVGKALASGLGAAAQYRKNPLQAAARVARATLTTPRQLVTNATQGAIGGGAFTALDDHLEAAEARRRVKKLVQAEQEG